MAPFYLRVFRRRRSMLLLLIVLLSSGSREILGARAIAEEDYSSGGRHKTGERKLEEQQPSYPSINNTQQQLSNLIVLLSSGSREILGASVIAEEDYGSGERYKTGERMLEEDQPLPSIPSISNTQPQISNLSINNTQLLKYSGDVLSSRDDREANAWYRILAIALSPDEQTIYYSEKLMTPSVDKPSFETNLVKKAEPVGPSNTTYNITYVAGPWPNGTDYEQYASFRTSNWASNATNGTDVRGLLMLNDNALALSNIGSNALWALDVISGSGEKLLPDISLPMQIVRHPLQNALFVSTNSLITKVPLSVPWPQSDVVAGSSETGYVDSAGQIARFQDPMIGPQAISRDGKALYVADYWNNVVRRVDTEKRRTETIAGAAPRFPSPEGGFNRSRSLALDSNNCNLFVSERDRGRIHWLRFDKPNGNVTAVDTVATLLKPDGSPEAIMSLYLTKSDTYLYAGTGDGQILKLKVNVSALLCTSEVKVSPSSSSSSMVVIGLSVGLVLGGIVLLGVAVFIYRQRCYGSTAQSTHRSKALTTVTTSDGHSSLPTTTVSGGASVFSETDAEWLAANSITAFPWSVIEKALTEGNCLTGKSGGYGDVYRCSLMVGKAMTDVAVKVMRGDLDAVKHRQFLAEVNTLSHVRHKNLCKLLGYCVEENRCVLLYPFVSGGSLYDRLHRTKPRAAAAAAAALEMQQQQQQQQQQQRQQQQQSRESSTIPGPDVDGWEPLKWTERLVIAKQLATCFRYLHHELEQPIIHRDIKSQNVLIDGKWKSLQAYVCDFGLAKPGNVANADNPTPSGKTTVFTMTQGGTPGYMAPEYIYDAKLTLSSDVFAFGVVLLELVSAKRAIIRVENGDPVPLYSWVKQHPLESILDPHLQDSLMPGENVVVCDLLNLALQCTDERISRRPSMVDIARAIEEMLARPVR